jgi:hypothetical protein
MQLSNRSSAASMPLFDSTGQRTSPQTICEELDNADDAVIEGLESYLELIDPKEIQYLEDLLWRFDNTCGKTIRAHSSPRRDRN